MPDDLDDLGLSSRPDLAVQSLRKIKPSGKQLPSPAFVAYAVIPEPSSSKRAIRLNRIAHEASSGMRVHRQEEWDEEVMRVPKRLKALLSDLCMRGREHEKHTQQHDMSSNTSGLLVVDLDGSFRSHLRPFDIEEVDVVAGRMNDSPEEHAVCDLAMKVLALVQWQPS